MAIFDQSFDQPEARVGILEAIRAFRSGADGTRTRESECYEVSPGGATRGISASCVAADVAKRRVATSECSSAVNAVANPRKQLVRALSDALTAASEAGDLHTARVAHEAIGRLLEPASDNVTELHRKRANRSEGGTP